MKYNSEKVSGDAGEHFFAYWIINNFQYPCRLLDKDLGLDAKIEIVDNNQETTGEFIFVQIKSSKSIDIKHSITLRHFLYWESISIPVMLIGINLLTSDIYWLHINDVDILNKYKKRAIQSQNKHTIINLGQDGVKLDPQDKVIFETLRFKHIIPMFEDALENLESATNNLIETYGNVTDYATFSDAATCSIGGYYELVSDYILNVDWLITNSQKVQDISKEYSDIVNHLQTYTKSQINNIVQQTDRAFKIIEITNTYMERYIKAPSIPTEHKKEVLIQLSNYDSVPTSKEAQKLVQLVNGII